MRVELKVPEVGESITDVQIAQWYKAVGDHADKDENLVEIETDKATVELPAPVSGTITQILKQQGQQAHVGEVIGYMTESGESGAASSSQTRAAAPPPKTDGQAPAKSPGHVMPAAERLMAEK